MSHALLSDPFVAAMVEDAVAPYRDRLLPEDLAWLQRQLAMVLEQDTSAATLLAGAHPRARDVDASGERGPLAIDDGPGIDDSPKMGKVADGKE